MARCTHGSCVDVVLGWTILLIELIRLNTLVCVMAWYTHG